MTNRTARGTFVVALALTAGACGSETAADEPTVASLPTEAVDDGEEATPADSDSAGGEVSDADAEAANLRYQQCMTDLGVDEEELFGSAEDGGTLDIDQADFEAFEEAQKECVPILEEVFGSFELSPEDEAAQQDILARHNQCMADNGFEPNDFDGFEIPEDGDTSALDAAIQECSEIFEELNAGLQEPGE